MLKHFIASLKNHNNRIVLFWNAILLFQEKQNSSYGDGCGKRCPADGYQASREGWEVEGGAIGRRFLPLRARLRNFDGESTARSDWMTSKILKFHFWLP